MSTKSKQPVVFTVVIPNRLEKSYREKTEQVTDLRHKLQRGKSEYTFLRNEPKDGHRKQVSEEIDDVLSILKKSSHGQVNYKRNQTLSEEDLPPMHTIPHDRRHRKALNRVCRSLSDDASRTGCVNTQQHNPTKTSNKTVKSVVCTAVPAHNETKSEALFVDLNKSLDLIEDFDFINDSMSILNIEQKNKRLGLSNIEMEKQRHERAFRKSAEQSLATYADYSAKARLKWEQQVQELKDRKIKQDSTIQSEYNKLQEYYQKKFQEGRAIIQHVEESEKKKKEEEATRLKQVKQSWNNILTYEKTTFEVLNATKKCVPDPKIDPEIERLFKEIGDLQQATTNVRDDAAQIYNAGELGPHTALQYEQSMYGIYSRVLVVIEKLNVAIKRVNMEIAAKLSAETQAATEAQQPSVQSQQPAVQSRQTAPEPQKAATKEPEKSLARTETSLSPTKPPTDNYSVSAEAHVKKNIISASAFALNQTLEENLKVLQESIVKLVSSKEKEISQMRSALKLITVTPINSISASSTQHMKNKVNELSSVLSGKETTRNNKTINPGLNNLTLNYCFDVAASKFVDQACEQVAFSDNVVPAFSIAAVLTGIWQNHPVFGKLFLAHLYKRCPYSIPAHWPKKPGEHNTAYLRRMGYAGEGESVEEKDKFLQRMEGCIKLYSAIIVTPAPYSDKPHPHGLAYGWLWLSRVLNMEPLADVTATMIEAFLNVAGSALHHKYKSQFLKMLDCLYTHYLPKLEAVTDPKHLGPITRLKLFLEKVKKEGALPVPNGRITHAICS